MIADLAAQHHHLGFTRDCLRVARFGEVDERVGPPVRMILNGVKARAYGSLGDTDACRRHLDLAEEAFGAAGADAGWRATVATPGRLPAIAGHALAALARRRDSAAVRAEAQQHLAKAVDALDRTRLARSAALCLAELATLHAAAGERHDSRERARQAHECAAAVRSARLAGPVGMDDSNNDDQRQDDAAEEPACRSA